MSLSSEELNYLIWRYLQEAGFELSTYALQQESGAQLLDSKLSDAISRGCLVNLVQKGIQFMEVEASIREDSRGDAFTLLSALSLDAEESGEDEDTSKVPTVSTETKVIENGGAHGESKGPAPASKGDPIKVDNTVQADIEPIETVPIRNLEPVYETGEAQASEWSSAVSKILAIGTPSGGASILNFDSDETPDVLSLYHPDVSADEKDICSVAWNGNGSLLATGGTDGKVRVWTRDGKLRHALALRRAPIIAARWNGSGTHILSIDCLNNVVAWDAQTGDVKQSLQFYPSLTFEDGVIKGPNYEQVSIGTDAVWIDNNTYAATGDNASLMIHRLTETAPVMRLRGHTQGINSLNFDSASQLLASGSDDHTVRIWHGKSQVSIMSLVGHTGPVMVVRWHQPPASLADSLDPEMKAKSLLISASTDGTVRIWHPYRGVALCILALHEGPIFFCEVSPNGKFLATGGADQVLIIWDLSGISVNSSTSGQTQQPSGDRAVFRYEPETSADGDSITSISWNLDSTRVFVGYGTKSVVLSI